MPGDYSKVAVWLVPSLKRIVPRQEQYSEILISVAQLALFPTVIH